jgi:hypothetical protein
VIGIAGVIAVLAGILVIIHVDREEPANSRIQDVSPDNLPWGLGRALGDPRPTSLVAHRCRLRQAPSAKDVEFVLGCRVTLAAEQFDGWRESFAGRLIEQPVTSVPAHLELFDVGDAFVIAAAYSDLPLGERDYHGPLIFASASRSDALLYYRMYLVRE